MTASVRVSLDAFGAGARAALQALAQALGPGQRAWVAGGAVRDVLSGSGAADLDIAVPSGAAALARRLADRLGAAYVLIDPIRGTARVAGGADHAWRGPQVDVTDFRGPDLSADLRGRDFTVNALAVAVSDLTASGEGAIEDPTGGLHDLRDRIVRLCAPLSLEDDPVRVLRAARLAIQPGWRLDPGLEGRAAMAAHGLTRVSAERTRDEVLALFGEPVSAAGLRLLDRWGALAVVLPERDAMEATAQPAPHRFDVWEHSVRCVEGADLLAARCRELVPWGEALGEHLGEALGDGATRREALKLAALLHDVAKPETRTGEGDRVRFIGHDVLGAEKAFAIAERLRLSGRLTAVLERLVRHHLRAMHLAIAGDITRRARYRFFRDLGDEAQDLLLLAVADSAALTGDSPFRVWAGDGGRVVRELMAGHAEEAAARSAPPLVDGREVMAALGLPPGPELGRLLHLLREAQAVGAVTTREAALEYLRRLRDRPLDTSEPSP